MNHIQKNFLSVVVQLEIFAEYCIIYLIILYAKGIHVKHNSIRIYSILINFKNMKIITTLAWYTLNT